MRGSGLQVIGSAVLAGTLAGPARAQGFPSVDGSHSVLVTVDDLPIPSRDLHPDDADRERITRDLLAVLEKHGIKAIGFVTWGNVGDAAGEKLLDLWLAAGHELGNHTYGHLDYSRTDAVAYIADAEKGRSALGDFLAARQRRLRFFRFPFLREGDTLDKLRQMREWLRKSGQSNVPVTIDGQDWSFEKPWVIAQRNGDEARLARLGEDYQHALRLETVLHTAASDAVFERPTPQVILLHANAVGAAQWDALFTWMKGRGFRFASADEVLVNPAFKDPPEFVGRYGSSHWGRVRHERRRARAREQIADRLERQIADWNRGDLVAFCSLYDEGATFLSPSGITRGRAAVLERYQKRYPDAKAMGRLSLEWLEVRDIWGPEVTSLGDAVPGAVHGASIAARWTLQREDGTETSGHTLLVLERRGDAWWIVQDASM